MTPGIVRNLEVIDVDDNGGEAAAGINGIEPKFGELQFVRVSIGEPGQIVDVRDFLQLDIQKRQLSALYLAAEPHKISQTFLTSDAVVGDHGHRDGTDG